MRRILFAFIVLVVGSPVLAEPVFVENHSFEADFAAPGTFPVFVPQGWSVTDPNNILDFNDDAVGVLNPAGTTYFTPDAVTDGSNAALIYLAGDIGGGPVGLMQTLGTQLQPNTHYTLQVDVGNIAAGFGTGPFADIYFELSGFPGYTVQLLAGDLLLDQDMNTLTIVDGQWGTSVVEFTTGQTLPIENAFLQVHLINLNQIDTPEFPGIEVDFDNVRLDATVVPEPASMGLLVAGLILLAPWRAKRRKPRNALRVCIMPA